MAVNTNAEDSADCEQHSANSANRAKSRRRKEDDARWRDSAKKATVYGKRTGIFGAGRGVLVTERVVSSDREQKDGAFSINSIGQILAELVKE